MTHKITSDLRNSARSSQASTGSRDASPLHVAGQVATVLQPAAVPAAVPLRPAGKTTFVFPASGALLRGNLDHAAKDHVKDLRALPCSSYSAQSFSHGGRPQPGRDSPSERVKLQEQSQCVLKYLKETHVHGKRVLVRTEPRPSKGRT